MEKDIGTIKKVTLPDAGEQMVLCDSVRNMRILQNAIEGLAVDLEEYPTTTRNLNKKSRAIYMLAKIIDIKENLSDKFFSQSLPLIQRVQDYMWRNGRVTHTQLQKSNICGGVGAAKKLDTILAILDSEQLLATFQGPTGKKLDRSYQLIEQPIQIAEQAKIDGVEVVRYAKAAERLMGEAHGVIEPVLPIGLRNRRKPSKKPTIPACTSYTTTV